MNPSEAAAVRDKWLGSFSDETTPSQIELCQELHEAVYGEMWARPESPESVWQELLAKVRAMREECAT